MGKKAIAVVGVLVILFSLAGLVLHLQKDKVTGTIAETIIADATGFGVEIGSVDTRLSDLAVTLTDIRLTNPPQFTEREAFNIPHVYAEATFKTLLQQEQHLRKLHLKVDKMMMVRNPDGETNMDQMSGGVEVFSALGNSGSGLASLFPMAVIGATPELADGEPQAVELTIDEFKVFIGQVEVVDYVLGKDGKPMNMVYDIQDERMFLDVTDIEQVVKEMSVAMTIGSLSKNLGNLLSPEALEKLDENAPELMKGLMEFMGGTNTEDVEQGDENQDGVDAMKDALKAIFQ